jgi:intracellular sulfur oxidation DsrE/DsrF family protein
MRGWFLIVAGLASMGAVATHSDSPALRFPEVARYGGVVGTAGAAEPPRRGAKIVFDITAESKADEVNKGLESVARYLNLNADAGLAPADVKLALVLHGAATRAALAEAAYARHSGGEKNPNRELPRELEARGVELFVCGQSLARHKFAPADVAEEVSLAVSAMTVNANKQQDGYSHLSIH